MAIKLTDRVYYTPHNHDTDRPALGIVIGDRAVMLIDAGNSPSHAGETINDIRALTDKPLKYIGLSHWHWDHSFGLSAYEDVCVIAHPECAEKLSWMQSLKWDDASLDERVKKGEEIEFCAENIKKEFKNREDIKIRTPDILTEGGLSVDLGGCKVTCFYIGGEHSTDSLGYFVEGEKVLFLGDSLCHNMFSGSWSYDLDDFRRRLSTFSELDVRYFVNGHWAPQNKEEFRSYAENMLLLGEIAGSSLAYEEARSNYISLLGKSPDEETLDLLNSFVEGNLKKAAEP